MDCSCKELSDCMEEKLMNDQGSDVLTVMLIVFIWILSYIFSCIEETYGIND
jgi:hypothetical protein